METHGQGRWVGADISYRGCRTVIIFSTWPSINLAPVSQTIPRQTRPEGEGGETIRGRGGEIYKNSADLGNADTD